MNFCLGSARLGYSKAKEPLLVALKRQEENVKRQEAIAIAKKE